MIHHFPNFFFVIPRMSKVMAKRTYNKWGTPTTLTARERATIERNRAKALQLQRLRSVGTAPLATRGFVGGYGAKGEKKFYDINTATYQVNTTGSITLLFVPQLGTDFNARIGRKTKVTSLYIRGRLQNEIAGSVQTGNIAAQQARMIVFIDLQPNGAAPAVTDVLVEALPSSQLNANNRDRFLIVKDKVFYFDPVINQTTATQSQAAFNRTGYNIKLYKKCAIETIFNATNGGTIGDISSGAVYMMWIGSTAAGVNTDVNAIVSTRCRYLDA